MFDRLGAVQRAATQSTQGTMPMPEQTGSGAPPHARVGDVLCGRFQLQRQLGQGANGIVYEAFDRESSRRVAVKVCRRLGPGAIFRLKREARELLALSHPNIVSVFELVGAHDEWLFIMEVVDGAPFDATVRSAGLCDFPRLRLALRQLVVGLEALHAAGRVHRDLKPANVLLAEDGRLVIIDLGVVHSVRSPDPERGFLGTPAYAAPEQMAGDPVGPSADWYAVGVMIYQALTGVLPFRGTYREIMSAKRTGWLRPPSQLAPATPPDLERLCLALMHADPVVRGAGITMARVLFSGPPKLRETGCRRSVPLVGREQELSLLRSALMRAARGESTLAVVHGPCGVGKSSLLQRFASDLPAHAGSLVLQARCHAQERVPFQGMDGLVDALSSHLRGLPLARAAGLLTSEVHHLARIFPVLNRVEALAEVPQPSQWREPDAATLLPCAAGALATLLESIGRLQTVVVLLDDVDLMAEDARTLLDAVISRVRGAVLWLFTARSRLRMPFGAWRMVDVALSPLSPAAVQSWLAHEHGTASQAWVAHVYRESQGQPLHIRELARRTGQGGAPISLSEAIAERLSGLTPVARSLLEATVHACGLVDRRLLLAVVENAQLSDLHWLCGQEWLRAVSASDGSVSYEPYHELLAVAVRARCSEADRTAMAERLADGWRAMELADPVLGVRYLLRADRKDEAAALALVAGENARQLGALQLSADMFTIGLSHGPSEVSQELWYRAGQVFAAAGRYRQAASVFLRCAALAATSADRFELERKALENQFLAGDQQAGLASLVALGKQVGLPVPRSRVSLFVRWLVLAMRYCLFGVPKVVSPELAEHSLRPRAALAWSGVSVQTSDVLAWAYAALRALGETARAGLEDEFHVLSVVFRAGMANTFGPSGRCDARVIAAAEAQQATSSVRDWLHACLGLYQLIAGNLVRASAGFEAALSAAGRRSSARRFAQGGLLTCWFYAGDVRSIATYAEPWASEAEGAGDRQFSAYLRQFVVVSQLSEDRSEALRGLAALRAAGTTTRGKGFSRWSDAWFALFLGHHERAHEIMRAASWRHMLGRDRTAHVLDLFLRGQVAAASMSSRPERAKELRRAVAALSRFQHAWSGPLSRLLSATHHAFLGERAVALRLLEQAEPELEMYGLRGLAAAARVRRHQLLGQPDETGHERLGRLGIVGPEWLEVLTPGFASLPHALTA